MNIDKKQLQDSPKYIGKNKGNKVYSILTKGGLAMILEKAMGKVKVLAASPHIAFSKFLALKNNPELIIEELSKSENDVALALQPTEKYWSNVVNKLNNKLE